MNRASATWELLTTDVVNDPGKNSGLDYVQNAVIGVHNAVSNIGPTILTPIDQNEYFVDDRKGIVDGTVEATRRTLKARWFKKGNPLNFIAKGATGLMEFPDGVISDVLHLGGKGKVIKAA